MGRGHFQKKEDSSPAGHGDTPLSAAALHALHRTSSGAAGPGHWIVGAWGAAASREVTGAQSRCSEEASSLEKRPHPVHRASWETAQSLAQNTERKVVTRVCPGPCTLLLVSGHLPLDGQLSRLSSHPLPTGLSLLQTQPAAGPAFSDSFAYTYVCLDFLVLSEDNQKFLLFKIIFACGIIL